MRLRRTAREKAVQFLFQHDLNPIEDLDKTLKQFWLTYGRSDVQETPAKDENSPSPTTLDLAIQSFANPLIHGVLKNVERIDAIIVDYVKNWRLPRIATVDRNVLRLALYELLYCDDIPPVVSINEAIDIAKKFSTEDSGKFVNGILDEYKKELLRPDRCANLDLKSKAPKAC